MIIKSSLVDGFSAFSDYLKGEGPNRGDNETCGFVSSDNPAIRDISSWCLNAGRIAATKRRIRNPVRKPIDHIVVRTRSGDILTPEMIKPRVSKLLEKLGYQNCPWVLVEHLKKQNNGNPEPHYHLGVLRIDYKGNIRPRSCSTIYRQMSDKFALELGFKCGSKKKQPDKYTKQSFRMTELWSHSRDMAPIERLAHFIKGMFLPARSRQGSLVFVDQEGKPHSLGRVLQARASNVEPQDMPNYFGLSLANFKELPLVKQLSGVIKRRGWKLSRDLIVKGIADGQRRAETSRYPVTEFGRDFNPLSKMHPWHGLQLPGANQFLPSLSNGAGFLSDHDVQSVPTSQTENFKYMGDSGSNRARGASSANNVRNDPDPHPKPFRSHNGNQNAVPRTRDYSTLNGGPSVT